MPELPIVLLLMALSGGAGALIGCRLRGAAQRTSDARLKAVLEHSLDAAYRRDLRTDTYDYFSPAIETVMGLTAGQMQSMSVTALLERIHPDDRARVVGAVEESLTGRNGRIEYRFRGNSGDYRWIADHYAVEVDAHGIPTYRSGILRDVSDRKDAESALHASEYRYRTLFESIEDGFCIIEILLDEHGKPADYRFVETNPAFAAATGLSDAVGHTALGLVPDLDRWWVNTYGRIALTGEAIRFEHHAPAMNRWFDVYAFRFGLPEQRQVAIFFKNVTGRKLADLERVQLLDRERVARAEAERASRLKDDFLATVSHELRTPLNSILGWAQLVARGATDAATLEQGLGAIERNALAQARLIDDLLDMSRIASGLLRLDVQGVDLQQVVAAAVETVRPAAESKDIRLDYRFDDVVSIVRGDATRLPQVAWNLLSNAVKFTPRGGAVRVSVAGDAAHVRLTIADTGHGIAPEFLPHVFERFRQADASTTRAHAGLGLGLAIVRQIVELHGGQVQAHSDGPGRGSTFVVELPRAPGEGEERRGSATADVDALGPLVDLTLSDLTILAVDDEPDALDVIRRVLEDRSARVVTASSAQEALRVFAEARPHVLLADVGMPQVDGYELIRRVRALGPEAGGSVPAAALTAFARSEDRTRALLAGYQTHLAKPVRPVDLVAAVASLAGRVCPRRAGA